MEGPPASYSPTSADWLRAGGWLSNQGTQRRCSSLAELVLVEHTQTQTHTREREKRFQDGHGRNTGIQFCGINALDFYAFEIFRESGVPESQTHYLHIGIGATLLISLSLSSFLIDRAGRKKLMGYGYLLMGIIMSILTVTMSYKDINSWIPYVNIALIFCVTCSYAIGPAGVSMALPAELFLQAWRPSAFVISGTINWLCMFLVGMLFSYIVEALGPFCFLIFVAYTVFSAAFLLYFVPETKGKTMVEVMEDFNKLNYKNRGADTEKTDVNLGTKI